MQRVWISLEFKGVSYQWIEVDPYAKPTNLLEINPQGLIPALKDGDWGSYESTVLMEYLEDAHPSHHLLPDAPKQRAHSRLWADHVNRKIIPAFYHYLQAQEEDRQVENGHELKKHIGTLVDAADKEGPFFLGKEMSFVDVQLAPWLIRLTRVLKPYRGWQDPEPGSRWARWVEAVEENEHVKATTSTDELYLDSYERYAGMLKDCFAWDDGGGLTKTENRPNTSQVANAINAGRGLP